MIKKQETPEGVKHEKPKVIKETSNDYEVSSLGLVPSGETLKQVTAPHQGGEGDLLVILGKVTGDPCIGQMFLLDLLQSTEL